MGDPKKQRKKYATPRFAWRTDSLQAELKLLGQYGLRVRGQHTRTTGRKGKAVGVKKKELVAKARKEAPT